MSILNKLLSESSSRLSVSHPEHPRYEGSEVQKLHRHLLAHEYRYSESKRLPSGGWTKGGPLHLSDYSNASGSLVHVFHRKDGSLDGVHQRSLVIHSDLDSAIKNIN